MAELASRSRHDLAATLALAQIPGVGAQRLRKLISVFGGAPEALRAPQALLVKVRGIPLATATAIREARVEQGEAILERLAALKARVLLADDPGFPPRLTEIYDPPAVLYVWGDLALTHRPGVAFVGSRKCSSYGLAATRQLVHDIALTPAVTISGMARGIDAAAHTAALDAGGGSVGVLGNGFGVIYPAANRMLYDRMIEHGCLITEHPPGERPNAGAFPRRNRLVAGLALATVVVEAAVTSGALITADCALDQGRAVLAVPGPITSPTSVGCNKLIQQGAAPALTAADILEEIGMPGISRPPRAAPLDLDDLQRSLWDAMGAESRHVDALVAAAGGDASRVLTALTELELRGIVRQEAGMRFGLR